MAQAAQAHSTHEAYSSAFLISDNRFRLSQMIRDPFVAAAFRAAEDDGLAPNPVEIDHPKALDGGAAAVLAAERLVATV